MHISNKIIKNDGIAFDDVLIVPTYSEVRSRLEPVTKTMVGSIELDLPIISAPMDTITERDMAVAMSNAGGMGIIHRFMDPNDQGQMLKSALDHVEEIASRSNADIKNALGTIGAAVGVGNSEFERLITMIDISGHERFTTIAIDVANGFSSYTKEMIDRVRAKYGSHINIIAGNVATGEGFDFLAKAGANAVRAGIGGGCFVPGTKVMTSCGLKPIEDIENGELVVTHTGSLKEVVNTMWFDRDEEIVSINGIECTKNHEFYVINSADADIVNDLNLHQYAFWIEAQFLDESKHLLIGLD